MFDAKTLLIAVVAVAAGLKLRELSQDEHSFAATKSCPTREDRTAYRVASFPRGPLASPLQEYFLNKDNLYIHFRRWLPTANIHPAPLGIVIISHGLGEHIARYHAVALSLNRAGFVVYGLDHQGHGRSEGDRLFVKKFSDFGDDVLQLTEIAKRENPTLAGKTFLLGHSMGGAIASDVLIRAQQEFKAAILSGPALLVDPVTAPPHLQVVAKLLARVLPRLPLDKLSADLLSHDKRIVDLYANDPLVYSGPLLARISGELLQAFEYLHKNAEKVTLPYLILHGEQDKLAMPQGSEQFHSKTSSKVKELKVLPGEYHEIFNEVNAVPIVAAAVNFLKSQL